MKRWIGLLCLFSLYSCGQSTVSSIHSKTPTLTFSVLTYNVQAHPGRDEDLLRRNLPIIGRKLTAFEIAGIQGCFTFCERLLDASRHLNKYYLQERPSMASLNSGLASLAHFPLIEVKTRFYVNQSERFDPWANKAILLMRYNIAGNIVDVYNTNIQSGDGLAAKTMWHLQAAELIHYIWMESPAENVVILHGDFNSRPSIFGTKALASESAGTEGLSTVMRALDLQDASGSVLDTRSLFSDRILFRSGSNTVFKPIAWENKSDVFVDGNGQPLSSSVPIAVRFEIQKVQNQAKNRVDQG